MIYMKGGSEEVIDVNLILVLCLWGPFKWLLRKLWKQGFCGTNRKLQNQLKLTV